MVEKDWQEYNDAVAKCMVEGDISNFTKWSVIRYTMFTTPPIAALEHLQNQPDWDKWKNVIVESPVGNPSPYEFYPQSSGNLIAQATHLSHFLLRTSCKLEDLGAIFEFGAGYGCMCRLIYNLGFSGKYVIMDLPALLALQRYYLGAMTNNRDIEFLSKEADYIKRISESQNSLFIAMWSLSETAIVFRERVLRALCSEYILLIYQDTHGDFDNAKFFSDFVEKNTNYRWGCFEIPHLPHKKQYYLFGERNEK